MLECQLSVKFSMLLIHCCRLDAQAEPSVESVIHLFIYYKKTTVFPDLLSPWAASFQPY